MNEIKKALSIRHTHSMRGTRTDSLKKYQPSVWQTPFAMKIVAHM